LKEGLLGDEGILNGNFDEFLWVLFLNFWGILRLFYIKNLDFLGILSVL
jgi:hypothetical protein